MSDLSPLVYLRERTCELDIGAFLHCKIPEDLLRAIGLWYCESWGMGENEKVKADSATGAFRTVGVVAITETRFSLV